MSKPELEEATDSVPVLFISYSWTSLAHEDWVLGLAEELRAVGGIDVRIDKWDLPTGGDAPHFMERSIVEADKVLIVSDCEYARKANARKGGAGIEAQILTPELYKESGGDEAAGGPLPKYAVVVREYDEEDKACTPRFYGGRIYIDMTDETRRAERVEEVIRWAFDKPLHQRPEIGARPAFLDDGPSTGTGGYRTRALAALVEARPNAQRAAEDYFDRLLIGLTAFIPQADDKSGPEMLDAQLESFKALSGPYAEALQVAEEVIRSPLGGRGHDALRRFVSGLFPFVDYELDGPLHYAGQWKTDPFRAMVPDLFRSISGLLIRHRDFEGFAAISHLPYDVTLRDGTETRQRSFAVLQFPPQSTTFAAHVESLLRGRHEELTPEEAAQADFLLFLQTQLDEMREPELVRTHWYPHLVAGSRRWAPHQRALPVFARATSTEHLDKLCRALRATRDELLGAIDTLAEMDPQRLQFGGIPRLQYRDLTNRERLGSRP